MKNEMQEYLGKKYSNTIMAQEILKVSGLRKSSMESSKHFVKCPHKIIKNSNDRIR